MRQKDSDIARKVKEFKVSGRALSDKEIHIILQHRSRVIQKLLTSDNISSAEKVAVAKRHYSPVYIEQEDGTRVLDVDASARACVNFIEDWGMIYNPHRDTLKTLPVILFPKQKDYVRWILAMYANKTNGCVDKCRDVGATWVAIFVACWLYLFTDGITIGFCTFKAEECDKMGNLGTLIPKARFFLENIPFFFGGKSGKDWTTKQYQIKNHLNNSSIVGLYGNSPGRGSRSTIVFKDESAFYENPEMVEAALDAHTSLSIDISTPNGTETLFYRKKRGILERVKHDGVDGVIPLFTFDWQDNPHHTQEWFDKKKRQAEYEGTMHVFKREILRDETSSLSDRVIPSNHIRAAIDAHLILPEAFPLTGRTGGFDIANSEVNGDTNAFVLAQGNRVDLVEEWAGLDSLKAAKRAWDFCRSRRIGTLIFDAIGVGATASTYFRDNEEKELIEAEKPRPLSHTVPLVTTEFVPFTANTPPLRPDAYEYSQDVPNNRLFRDLKAMAWWHVRTMFENTFRAVNGQEYDPGMLISINFADASPHQRMLFDKLLEELGQPTFSINRGKVVIDKKPKSARSPNLADAFVMCFTPIDSQFELSLLST